MKLLVFSDIHTDRKALDRLLATEADIYLCAGDLVTWARGLDEMVAPARGLGERFWMIPGNHESQADIERVCAANGFRNLHGASAELGGVHIAGLGYSSPTPFNTPGEYSEAEIATRLAPFAALRPLVLVCHCPPKETPLDGVKPGAHFGSTAVGEFLAAHQPAYFFCGHIHECEGQDVRLGATRAINVGKRGFLLDLDTLSA